MIDWETIVAQYGRLVWATVYRLVDNHADAADCFQETFLEAVEICTQGIRSRLAVVADAFATARALDHLRARSGAASAWMHRPIRMPAQPREWAQSRGRSERTGGSAANCLGPIARAAGGGLLPELHGQIELWRDWRAAEFDDRAVGVLLHRARERLRELLEPVDARPAQR